MKKCVVLALIVTGTFVAADIVDTIKTTKEIKRKTDLLEARLIQHRAKVAERKRQMEEQEDFDIKFDLIMNINYN